MNFDDVKELIAIINNSELADFELNIDNVSVRMSKNNCDFSAPFVQKPVYESKQKQEIKIKPEAENIVVTKGNIVTSPIVGTFYASQNAGGEPIVKKGDTVKKGDILCIIEAMKIMNEITSQFDGTVSEILASNGDLIEYGQPLFKIV